eukprot:CAMPEP_0178383124 /NCGR_PEP_ID=MMETSP0689_2-20121128/6842_1 /TAXON_ID=160604 /ORGANISM="Amphidinium massartii, Strain CS-259" /LENGTH=36 /DNA_ID= /DNA_START= /DNA_END= /DNA_ORIENTATION=
MAEKLHRPAPQLRGSSSNHRWVHEEVAPIRGIEKSL